MSHLFNLTKYSPKQNIFADKCCYLIYKEMKGQVKELIATYIIENVFFFSFLLAFSNIFFRFSKRTFSMLRVH